MTKKLAIFLIDAFRYDFITKEGTPFLFNLSQKGCYSKLKTILGYSVGIDPIFFSGTYPEQNNIWTYFTFNPKTKSLIAQLLWPLDQIPKSRISRYFHALVYRLFQSLKIIKFKEFPYNLPFKKLNYFEYVQKKHITKPKSLQNIPTLIDLFEKYHIKYKIFDWYASDKKKFADFIEQKNEKIDVLIFYLSDLDGILHKYGIKSTRTQQKLREIDLNISKVHIILSKLWPDFSFVIFSDHGITEVKKTIDLPSELNLNINFKEYKDYLAFYDATMARFWFFNEKSQKIIKKILKSKTYGKILTKSQYKEFHINFSHNKYGDLLFLMNPGNIIYPNYYSVFKPPQTMHSYDPNYQEMNGIFIFYPLEISTEIKDSENVINIFPTILKIFDIQVPNHCLGRNIILKSE